jgi:hypothetical protein
MKIILLEVSSFILYENKVEIGIARSMMSALELEMQWWSNDEVRYENKVMLLVF